MQKIRRTRKTPSSPPVGNVNAGKGKIGFTPAGALASGLCAAAPASASAPEARMVLRSTIFMGSLPGDIFSVSNAYLARRISRGKATPKPLSFRGSSEVTRCPLERASVLDLRWKLAPIRRQLRHHLLVQPDVHARGIIAVARVPEFLCQFFSRGEA